ncbi:MAG: hypothetical protein GY749_22920 [Desulfobacteraceae bacterium]|nr:hypothetical protein [Desulfobacteraceae bacterium]
MSNIEIWDALCKTDPAHTKSFTRAGGFSGTAIKPTWTIKRMTEQFGPCGAGWGINEPSFDVQPAGDETLVFCTVSVWYKSKDNLLYGVGGDKLIVKRKNYFATDDEAYKKAFTDAVTNALKYLGVGADVHMGQFDDNKYVNALIAEFAEPEDDTDLNNLIKGVKKQTSINVLNEWKRSTDIIRIFRSLTSNQQTKFGTAISEKRAELTTPQEKENE